MNNPHDKEAELKKVLALKRLETPPPRFFRSFSSKVIDQLNRPEPAAKTTWRYWLGLDGDIKPVLVCASGIVVCSLLLIGLIASLRVSPPKAPSAQPAPLARPDALPRVGDPVMISEFQKVKTPPSQATLYSSPEGDKTADRK